MEMLIGGKKCPAAGGEVLNAINPATGEVIGTFPSAGKEDVERCLTLARQGAERWGAMSMDARTAVLENVPRVFEAHRDELCALLCAEMGKPIRQCGEDLDVTVEIFKNLCEEARHLAGSSFMDLSAAGCMGDVQFTRYEPCVVVACRAPLNSPFDTLTQKVAAALVMGNSVVIKPPTDVTLSLIRYTELLIEAGVPGDVAQIVTGHGADVGDMVVRSEKADAISFTGSTEVGIEICRNSAPYLHRMIMELGGNDPFIIFGDADLGHAVQECWMRLRNCGQTCCASKRYIVHNSVKDAFAGKLVQWLTGFKTGDPADPATDVGTLINERAAKEVEEQIAHTVRQGAKLLYGGERKGAFLTPAVLVDVTPDMDVAKDMEIFGPVFPIIGFDTEEEALALANQTSYGLNAGCMSGDMIRALRVASKLQAGTVVLNGCSTWRGLEIPFGGYKMSGLGREGGRYSLLTMSQEKTVAIRYVR